MQFCKLGSRALPARWLGTILQTNFLRTLDLSFISLVHFADWLSQTINLSLMSFFHLNHLSFIVSNVVSWVRVHWEIDQSIDVLSGRVLGWFRFQWSDDFNWFAFHLVLWLNRFLNRSSTMLVQWRILFFIIQRSTRTIVHIMQSSRSEFLRLQLLRQIMDCFFGFF